MYFLYTTSVDVAIYYYNTIRAYITRNTALSPPDNAWNTTYSLSYW